jgi:hypothetical protein
MLDPPVVRVPPPPQVEAEASRWTRLPPANRQRLVWLLSQLLERQLEQGCSGPVEVGDEPAPDHP